MRSEARVVLLTDEERRMVRALIDRVVPGAEVRVFGSRATGRARRFSDLDLLFVSPSRLTLRQHTELCDLFEESELQFRVDVVAADDLAEGMVRRVEAEALPL